MTADHDDRFCAKHIICIADVMTRMFTEGGFFFTAPSFCLHCRPAALSDGSDAPALAPQLNSGISGRDTDILPAKRQTRGHPLNSREVWPDAPFRRVSSSRGEATLPTNKFFTFPPPGQHCMTHFLGKVKTNAAQYPVTTVKACFFSWSRGDTSDHLVCDRQSETNRAEREQSCGCDTVWYAVTASLSGMLEEETAEVVIAHTLACFFPPRFCGC